jgi:DNA-binding NtrC family response regulator
MTATILLVEDDQVQREVITDILEKAGYSVRPAASGEAGLDALRNEPADLLITDMRLPGKDGLEVLRAVKAASPDTEVVVMTAYATVKTAIEALKEGAIDYLQKPFDKEELLVVVAKALEHGGLRRENQQLRELVHETVAMGNLVGESAPMQRVFDVVRRAIPLTSTVLVQGESGTGKELVARHIHFAGPRQKAPFVVVNCAAIPEHLVESELFGHEKGAFTGAEASRPGKFELAHSGTLFLDEIGDMRLDSQAKLLRVLQDGSVERIGSTGPRLVDVRVIAATNRPLRERVDKGEFREDLFYRLEVLPIRLPPLRERMQDLPLLLRHFRDKLAKRLGKPAPSLSPEVVEAMRRYRWPGNVRELENTLEQLFILTDRETVVEEDLPQKLRERTPETGAFHLPASGIILEDLEQDLIRQALDRSGGSIKEAADLLGLSYKTLQYRLKKHEIDRKGASGD